ncbi:hypothetical protein ACWEF9_32755 [Streptomyces sp. NPDC004980]
MAAARTRARYTISHGSASTHASTAEQAPHRLPTAAAMAGRDNGR